MITLTLNGKARELEEELALDDFLERFGIDQRLVAVAHNGDVVPRDHYEEVQLRDGDQIEVVRMVGGG